MEKNGPCLKLLDCVLDLPELFQKGQLLFFHPTLTKEKLFLIQRDKGERESLQREMMTRRWLACCSRDREISLDFDEQKSKIFLWSLQ
ncbi:hypothetical protein OIU79_010474 [Salix purpurea]|uniref:Uncharacterized protein n=1 Tax=Salix purpurea TaxID=77065 RepID=A0A9Q0QGT9_SALPP|nr:hypothetical protein OIU79_010474 [Salix purpurea]